MRLIHAPVAFVLALTWVASAGLQAQDQPRQLSPAELARIQNSISQGKSGADQAAQQQAAFRQQEEARRQQQQAIADTEADWTDDDVPPAPAPGFAEILAHGANVFQDEMAKKNAEQAANNARLAQIRREAESIQRDRERQQQQREREAWERQRQIAQQAAANPARNIEANNANQARERQMREDIAAERQRLAEQKQQAAKLEAERQARARATEQAKQQAEQQRMAAENAAAERQRKAEADRKQALRQAEQNLRAGFSGRAATCIGGGKDVLYLQTSRPTRTGCNVSFEARCPGTPSGSGVRFAQANYIGGSCQGLGDNIRIGEMSCAAAQVLVQMTQADCGLGG